MTTWLKDENGNKCSVEYFGDKEGAQIALDSLENCKDCVNCSDCSDCSDCFNCSDCSDCFNCSDCSDCSYCSHSLQCDNCLYCTDCNSCIDCRQCSYCIDCRHCDSCSEGYVYGNVTGQCPAIPAIKNIHKKLFAAVSAAPDALDMGEWHSCATTHCRAGWVVHLAGDAGYVLEKFHDTLLAAQLIYRASGYRIDPYRFYDDKKTAMADIKRLAESEAQEEKQP